jgi:Protein of unknown function (DUF4235)
VARLLYKPVGLLFGVLGGIVAGAIFKRLWRVVANESDTPNATDEEKGWLEVVSAAAAQGAVFGAVKALIDRAGAVGFARVTGAWPGETKS